MRREDAVKDTVSCDPDPKVPAREGALWAVASVTLSLAMRNGAIRR